MCVGFTGVSKALKAGFRDETHQNFSINQEMKSFVVLVIFSVAISIGIVGSSFDTNYVIDKIL